LENDQFEDTEEEPTEEQLEELSWSNFPLDFEVPLKEPLSFASFTLPTTPISPPPLSTPTSKIMVSPDPWTWTRPMEPKK
jgi:hypothetical protein